MPYLIDYTLIRETMKQKNISMQKLADMIGISKSSVSRKLNGEFEFTVSESQMICDVLGLKPSSVFFARPVPNPQR